MHPDLFFSAHPIPFFMGQTTTRMILERRGYRCTSIRVVTDFAAGGSDDSVFPLASGTPPEICYPRRSACPSRAFGWSSLTTPWGFPCFARFPCVHTAATTPAQRLNVSLRSFHPDVSVFPDRVVGSTCALSFSRIARRSLALRPAHSRCHQSCDTLIEGFSHFVTSMTAPIASGWSGCRVGLAPTGKRRVCTAHTPLGH
jgi:hypothetical protein